MVSELRRRTQRVWWDGVSLPAGPLHLLVAHGPGILSRFVTRACQPNAVWLPDAAGISRGRWTWSAELRTLRYPERRRERPPGEAVLCGPEPLPFGGGVRAAAFPAGGCQVPQRRRERRWTCARPNAAKGRARDAAAVWALCRPRARLSTAARCTGFTDQPGTAGNQRAGRRVSDEEPLTSFGA